MPGYTRFWNWLINNMESYLTHAVWAMIIVFWFHKPNAIFFFYSVYGPSYWKMARVLLPKHSRLNLFLSGKRSAFDTHPLFYSWSAPRARKALTPVLHFWYISVAFHLHPRLCAEQQSPQPPHSLRDLGSFLSSLLSALLQISFTQPSWKGFNAKYAGTDSARPSETSFYFESHLLAWPSAVSNFVFHSSFARHLIWVCLQFVLYFAVHFHFMTIWLQLPTVFACQLLFLLSL